MRLTYYTDFALRVLLYAGAADESVTISRISTAFGISKDHLRKVVHSLSQQGYVVTTQGRAGGIRLARDPKDINVREVVEHFESDLLVQCFNLDTNTCPIDSMCGLKHVFMDAQQRFMETLGNYTLADLITNPRLVRFARDTSTAGQRIPVKNES